MLSRSNKVYIVYIVRVYFNECAFLYCDRVRPIARGTFWLVYVDDTCWLAAFIPTRICEGFVPFAVVNENWPI